jgi:hypothetical protein
VTEQSTNPKDQIGRTKPPLDLIPPTALIYLALGFRDGAAKYGPFNWRDEKVSARVYVGACMRHLAQWLDGEENADDSGLPHLAHAISCIAILADAKENEMLVDDRPKKGRAAELMKRWTEQKRPPIQSVDEWEYFSIRHTKYRRRGDRIEVLINTNANLWMKSVTYKTPESFQSAIDNGFMRFDRPGVK